MKLKVDLECDKCYQKVKKILCKLPQIRDQSFDEKSNIVIIKVVCCSPEKIMDKLCSKGGGSIKTIEIVPPPKPSQPQPPHPQAQPPKPSQPKPPPPKPKDAEKPKQQPEKPKESEKPKEPEKPKQPEKPANNSAPVPKQQGPPPQATMIPQGQRAMYYGPYYEGYGGPALNGYGMQPPQQPYECYGRPVYDSWGGGYQPPPPAYRPSHPSRCDYFTEDNPQTCSIM